MKTLSILLFSSFCVCTELLSAPIAPIDLDFDFAVCDYVVGEPVQATLKIRNQSTRQITLGIPGSPEALRLEIRQLKDRDLIESAAGGNIITSAVTLKPGDLYEKNFTCNELYDLSVPGKYLVNVVTVAFDQQYESKPRILNVVPGIPLKKATQMFSSNPGLQRTFSLVTWRRNEYDSLFVRIQDTPTGKIWNTIYLAPILRQNDPRIDVAPTGEITILHRSSQYYYQRTLLWSLPNEVLIRARDLLRDPDNAMAARLNNLETDIKAEAEKRLPEDEKKKIPANSTSSSSKYLPPSQQKDD